MRVLDTALPRLRACALVALVAVLAAGCASRTHKAPVEQRQPAAAAQAPAATVPSPAVVAPAVPVLPGAENAGKPGYYTVKPGDTLIRIGLEAGQNWRDIARWNGLGNANVIEVGQVLRVMPPAGNGVAVQPVTTAGPVESRPLDAAAAAPTASAPPVPTPAVAAARIDPEEDLGWAWPAGGPVLAAFDDNKTKGLVIGGQAGDPVLASAAGRVVYAGSGLRGYGNLVIVKHNASFLTAYAHNQALLVKEDEVVRRGQKIAEMGSTDAERVQLHFEIRRQGRPIDPARLLPPR
ncbi:MAG: peptidoglycan DD-metalloendopeptidase family protein [Burkholderiaceae bacterium]|jgi:lipoprotein NlpD|nr:peptidoglycan DD-metalloendopeptidase family protein [Burkholderiaceae bacterium]